WATIGRVLTRIRPAIAGVGVVAGLIALVLEGIALSMGRSGVNQAMTVASFITSAALLGGTCTAMILGHWYLVIPSMEVSYLQSMVKLHIVSLVIRVAVVVAAIFVAVVTWRPGLGPGFPPSAQFLAGLFFRYRL